MEAVDGKDDRVKLYAAAEYSFFMQLYDAQNYSMVFRLGIGVLCTLALGP